ncbi:DNA helicase [Arthrobacter phage Qui]|uniref:DNA helicase n=1 Tax=Arthrobacter phage Qui TaxID=2603260 RepID=A0A5B8WHV8_9CAUD|nr:DNA helicase [Arthrobacter phage Qui]QED11629.1 DNA helicase [Arthrobacter phage Qui]QOC56461.1 DNA helicase [Arthrobacter phage Paella]
MAAIELYPHQLKALEKMHNGCVLTGDVGSGKSITSIAYYFIKVCGGDLRINSFGTLTPMSSPKDLYIITTARKRDDLDWEEEALPFGLSKKFELSHSGAQLFVDSWNNVPNYQEVENAFFIFDEQRLVGSGAWVKAFIKIAKANQWIMLSATPGDNWMDYIPLFVANGFYKNRTEFIRTHVVYNNFSKFPKVDRYVEQGVLLKHRRSILVEMPFDRHTTRHVKNILVKYDEEKFEQITKKRWHIYEERPIRDVGELFIVMRKLVNTDPSRLKAVATLYEKHPRLIVFYNYNYELDQLRTLEDILEVPFAEWNGQKHEPIPGGDKWVYLVQYTAGAEGWNCVETNATVFYSLNYSYKINHQAKGRIDRMNTKYTDLYYYILRSTSMIDNAIMKSITLKKNFNESQFYKSVFALAA